MARIHDARVDDIPVLWAQPDGPPRGLALWLTHLGGDAARCAPMLERLAGAGLLAVSFDPPGHGLRGSDRDPWAFAAAVLGSFRRRMWPLLGLTTLECLRVIDWALDRFDVSGPVVAGGVSMGGDVSVALAGIDTRITRVGALVATPDWTRPHMRALDDPEELVDQGEADAYALWYYDRLDPMTHLRAYARDVAIRFHGGEDDHHVPLDDARAFRAALADRYPDAAERIVVCAEPGAGHLDVDERFYAPAARWLAGRG